MEDATVKIYERSCGKSIVPAIPTGSHVLVRMSFKLTTLSVEALAANKKTTEIVETPVTYDVVGIGSKVEGLIIGDLVSPVAPPDVQVKVANNKNSLEYVSNFLKELPKSEYDDILRAGTEHLIVRYGIYNEYQLPVILL